MRLAFLQLCYYGFIFTGPTQDDLVEEQNEALTKELASKVSRLKNVFLLEYLSCMINNLN